MTISCCRRTFRGTSYIIEPQKYLYQEMTILQRCPVCGHYILKIKRILSTGELQELIFRNKSGMAMFDKLKKNILYKRGEFKIYDKRSYLNYNDYGTIKKCFSNLSTVKLGLFDNNITKFDDFLFSRLIF